MKSIYQLIPDIYRLVGTRDGWFTTEIAQALSAEISLKLQTNFGPREDRKTLRLSKSGPICPKHLWHSVHTPELAEPLNPQAVVKFAYGHIIESMALALAKAADHEVTGEQDELTVLDIKGHRDCVIDGYIVDVKSCSKPMFDRIQRKALAYEDDFGYLDQLDGYMVGSAEDDLVRHKSVAFIWAIEKVTGAMCLYEHHLRYDHIVERLALHKAIVARSTPPACTCKEVKDGESGNLKLDVKGSYSPFKWVCKPGLRRFNYADGPHFLTRVVRHPAAHILEFDKHGQRVYTM